MFGRVSGEGCRGRRTDQDGRWYTAQSRRSPGYGQTCGVHDDWMRVDFGCKDGRHLLEGQGRRRQLRIRWSPFSSRTPLGGTLGQEGRGPCDRRVLLGTISTTPRRPLSTGRASRFQPHRRAVRGIAQQLGTSSGVLAAPAVVGWNSDVSSSAVRLLHLPIMTDGS